MHLGEVCLEFLVLVLLEDTQTHFVLYFLDLLAQKGVFTANYLGEGLELLIDEVLLPIQDENQGLELD